MLFDGRNRIRFPYSRYGYTRGMVRSGTVALMLTALTIQLFTFRDMQTRAFPAQ